MRPMSFLIALSALVAASDPPGLDAEELFEVEVSRVQDQKAVFATVESLDLIPARARIGGVVAGLVVDEGDRVEADQQIALIGDEKLQLQLGALNSRIHALEANRANALTELERARSLFERNIIAKARLDAAKTAFDVAEGELNSIRAERSVLLEQQREGAVVAPSAGVVLEVEVIDGTVVLRGEAIALIAAESYVLRLALPESHARFVEKGDKVRIDEAIVGENVAGEGLITRVYPRIEEGRVIADASVEGLGDFFVGERVRVLIEAGARNAIIVPEHFVSTRFGIDFVRVQGTDGEPRRVAIQRGRKFLGAEGEPALEILTGLAAGDVLVVR